LVARVDDTEDVDLRAVAGTLWSKRHWIVASVIVFTIPFVAAAFLIPPVYRAATLLADARTDSTSASTLNNALSQLGSLGALARIGGAGANQVDEAMAVMKSRDFTERFIEQEKLLPELFPKLWDQDKQQWVVPKEQVPTLTQGYKMLDSVRSITQAGRGGLVTLAIEWGDPVVAARWVNLLVARLNAEMRERAIASTNSSVTFLESELETTATIDTRQSINRLMEVQINQRMLANVTKEYAFRVVDKALPPEPDDIVRPRKIVLMALGPTIGFIFGVFAILAWNVLVSRSRSHASS
jgi:uncharacterized protein involved in exopolysaccharide biosynthesis